MAIVRSLLKRWVNVEPGEGRAVVAGFLLLFAVFTCYFSMRPVRETMGVAGGVEHLQWLFTATFVATVLVSPLFGWLASRTRRRAIANWVLGFFALNIGGFALAIHLYGETVWLARSFFVWLSVFNLTAVSLAWSVLVDVFTNEQAKRLFAVMATGASLGGLVGPMIGVLFVTRVGNAGLLLFAAVILALAILCSDTLAGRDHAGSGTADCGAPQDARLGGSPFAGLVNVLSSPFLLSIALFVVLLASVSTFLYFEQARFVAANFASRAEQTRFFSAIDAIVQFATFLVQVFLTGRIAASFGIRVLLLALPLLMVAGFVVLSVSAMLDLFVAVMIVRRVGEYALVRPGREMLFTLLPAGDKYKAKNFIDTVVYRGADAVSGWIKTASDFLLSPHMGALAGAVISLAWAGSALSIVKFHRRMEDGAEAD